MRDLNGSKDTLVFQDLVVCGTAITTLADLQPLLSEEGSNLRIDLGAVDSILLYGVDEGDLSGLNTLFL